MCRPLVEVSNELRHPSPPLHWSTWRVRLGKVLRITVPPGKQVPLRAKGAWQLRAQAAAHRTWSDYPGGQQQIPSSVVIVVLGRGRLTRVSLFASLKIWREKMLKNSGCQSYHSMLLDHKAAIVPLLTLYYAKQRCLNLFESVWIFLNPLDRVGNMRGTWWMRYCMEWSMTTRDESFGLFSFLCMMSPWAFFESLFPQLPRNPCGLCRRRYCENGGTEPWLLLYFEMFDLPLSAGRAEIVLESHFARANGQAGHLQIDVLSASISLLQDSEHMDLAWE